MPSSWAQSARSSGSPAVTLPPRPPPGIGTDSAVVAGVMLFVGIPPATIVLRARSHRLSLGWTCVLLSVALVSLAATLSAVVLALALAYARVMSGF